MNNTITEKLVLAIKQTLPPKAYIAPYLVELLALGKEAVYRRLRGEVPFNINEVVLIANDLKISLDSILGRKNEKKVIFDLNIIDQDNPIESYYEILKGYIDILKMMENNSNASLDSAFNIIPHFFFPNNEHIAKFQLYKWLSISKNKRTLLPYSLFHIPEKVKEIQQIHSQIDHLNINMTYILNKNIFSAFANDVIYFHQMKMLTEEEKELIKEELIKLISRLEQFAIQGEFDTGAKIAIYISNINLDASYTFYQNGDSETTHFRIFSINAIESKNKLICQAQKEWLQALKDHSILITQSNRLHRHLYFTEQYEQIDNMFKRPNS